MAEDIVRFMGQHRLASADVLGHSMGGKTAMQLALNHPSLVRRLVVVDMAPRAYGPHFAALLRTLRELQLERFKARHEVDAALAPSVPEETLRQFLLKNLMPDPRGGYRWRINLDAIAANYDRLREAVHGPAAFGGQTLFLLGGNSNYVLDTDQREIHKLFPKVSFITIPDAGHWVHAEKPAEFCEAVLNFLGEPA
jgi:pimeloyl-ACP methyl ester carboxylesterase